MNKRSASKAKPTITKVKAPSRPTGFDTDYLSQIPDRVRAAADWDEQRQEALELVRRHVSQQLRFIGISPKDVDEVQDRIPYAISGFTWRGTAQVIKKTPDDAVVSFLRSEANKVIKSYQVEFEKLEWNNRDDRLASILVDDLQGLLFYELGRNGLSVPERLILSNQISSKFDELSSSRQISTKEAATLAAVAAVMAMRDLAGPFDARSTLLPDKIHETWSEREKNSKETPIEFFNRVWGKYVNAGILYQDDIKRLGDDKLVKAIRNYCAHHNLDPVGVLPPPRRERTNRLFAEAADGSAEKFLALMRLHQRQAGARYRSKRRPS